MQIICCWHTHHLMTMNTLFNTPPDAHAQTHRHTEINQTNQMCTYMHSNSTQPNKTHVCIYITHTHPHTDHTNALLVVSATRVGSLHLSSHTKLLVQSLSGRATSLLYRHDDRVTAKKATSPSCHSSLSPSPPLATPPLFYKQSSTICFSQ